MKFSPSRSVLNVEIRQSRAIYAALTGFALSAIAAAIYADIPRWLQLNAVAAALLYASYCVRGQARQCGRLQWRDSWCWQPQVGAERWLQLRAVTLWPGLIVLVFRDPATRKNLTLTLWSDSLDTDAERQLRVCLRHLPVFGESAA
jgi:hypothetical protein